MLTQLSYVFTIPKHIMQWYIKKNKQRVSKHLGRWGIQSDIVEKQMRTVQYNDYCIGPPKHIVHKSKLRGKKECL